MNSAHKAAIDRFVDQNRALWKFLAEPNLPHDERMALLKRAFPNAKSLSDECSGDKTS